MVQRKCAGRVLIVVENRPAGMDHRVAKQIDSLVADGYSVQVITQWHPANQAFLEVPAVRLLEYPPPANPTGLLGYAVEYAYSFLMAAALSVRALLRERTDVVQFCQPPDVYFLLAPMFRWAGVRVLVDQRDLLAEMYAARYTRAPSFLLRAIRLFERRSQRSAEHILCVNNYLRDRALAASGLPAADVSIIGNGPVLARVEQAVGDDTLRHGRKHLCCWVGEIGRQDRVDLVIRSIHEVVRGLGRSDCHFVVIGEGECLAEAKALARELRIGDWVQFPGFLPPDEVFRYLATADLGLDASLQFEVSPVKAMEYMAFGLPLVAFDLPETRAISDGAAAYAPPGDVRAHARAIDGLLSSPRCRQELGRAGRARVDTELAWEHQAGRYLRVIERLCATGRRARS
jgi:glycosyltransferase involved in cell wall biosynthesis